MSGGRIANSPFVLARDGFRLNEENSMLAVAIANRATDTLVSTDTRDLIDVLMKEFYK
jgi:hypothetical protein